MPEFRAPTRQQWQAALKEQLSPEEYERIDVVNSVEGVVAWVMKPDGKRISKVRLTATPAIEETTRTFTWG